MPEYDAILSAPMCHLGARFTGSALTRLDFLPLGTPISTPRNSQADLLVRELESYWRDPALDFKLPYAPTGTPLQLRVWHALMTIPPGHTTTYGALAKQLGTAARDRPGLRFESLAHPYPLPPRSGSQWDWGLHALVA